MSRDSFRDPAAIHGRNAILRYPDEATVYASAGPSSEDDGGCRSVHPVHGRCYDLAGHYVDGKPETHHYIVAGDREFGEYEIPWTDEESDAAWRERLAKRRAEPPTEEPLRTLTRVEDQAARTFRAAMLGGDIDLRIADFSLNGDGTRSQVCICGRIFDGYPNGLALAEAFDAHECDAPAEVDGEAGAA